MRPLGAAAALLALSCAPAQAATVQTQAQSVTTCPGASQTAIQGFVYLTATADGVPCAPPLAAGTNIIGKVDIDQTTQGTTNGVQLKAGTAIAGKVGIDQTTPGTTNGVQVNAALPAGSAIIGSVGIDQTTPGTTNGVQLKAGTAIAGKVGIDQTTPGTTNNVTADGVLDAAVTSASVTSATTGATVATVGYGSVSFQITSIGSGNTITLERSNDNTTWVNAYFNLPAQVAGGATGGTSNAIIAAGIYSVPVDAAFYRWRVSTYGSGTVTVYTMLKRSPPQMTWPGFSNGAGHPNNMPVPVMMADQEVILSNNNYGGVPTATRADGLTGANGDAAANAIPASGALGYDGANYRRVLTDTTGRVYVAPTGSNVTDTPVIQNASYASGNCMGGMQTIALGSNTSTLSQIGLLSKGGLVTAKVIYLFSANPTGSTCTDKSTLTIAAADVSKLLYVKSLTPATTVGTGVTSIFQGGLALGVPSGGTIYAFISETATETPATTSDLNLVFSSY